MLRGMNEEDCRFQKAPDGTPICSVHKEPIVQVEVNVAMGENREGLGHFTAWQCPISEKQFPHIEGME